MALTSIERKASISRITKQIVIRNLKYSLLKYLFRRLILCLTIPNIVVIIKLLSRIPLKHKHCNLIQTVGDIWNGNIPVLERIIY